MARKYVYPKDESSALDIGLVEASGREPILKISNCAASWSPEVSIETLCSFIVIAKKSVLQNFNIKNESLLDNI